MAGPGYSSPFPTTHDTVGASTLATRLFMPSSPPPPEDGPVDSPDRAKSPLAGRVVAKTDEARVQKDTSPGSSRASSPDREAIDKLNARLADYTVDFSAFPSGQFGQDEEPLPELKLPHEDQLSDVGGPEDFTANMERYLMGMDDDDVNDHEDEGDKEIEEGQLADDKEDHSQIMAQEQEQEKERQQNSNLEQPNGDDEAELGEYSEFGPPVDMSTPSHFLRRTHGLAKEITHLENIEEDPDDEPDPAATPSVRRQILTSNKNEEEEEDEEETNEDLRNQIEELKDAVQARDNQLDRSYKRVLEAASAAEQIKHLQAELQRKTSLLDEIQAQHSDEALLREQIQLLQKQNEDKGSYLRRSSANESIFTTLQKQIGDVQKELQNRSTHPDLDAERLETIADLRHQLTLSQEQLKKRDAALDETLAKLKEITAAKELQLREKNTEIDGLKAQIDDHLLETEKLETEVDKVNREYQVLEERIASLETRNRPLEELNSTLEADLTRVQSQVTAQENALKAMAADLPLETGGSTYTEILELIKDLGGPPTTTRTSELPGLPQKEPVPRDLEMENLRQELAKLQAELKDASSVRKTLEAELNRSQEQAIEAQTLIKSIEGENTTLTKHTAELKSNLDTIQHELNQLKEEHSEALETIDRLHEENKTQQTNPPPSPLTPRNLNPNQKEKLEESHQAQLRSLQTAHTTAISTLRSSHADSTRKLRERLAVAEKRESKLKAELQHLRSSRSEHETQLQSLRAEIKRLESVIAVKDETAAAVDERIARSVEKREKEWERRIDLLLKERERMGRALLWTLGEKEVGEVKENFDEDGRRTKQAYRYKYAQKSGAKKA